MFEECIYLAFNFVKKKKKTFYIGSEVTDVE